jgi:hypothetical protein
MRLDILDPSEGQVFEVTVAAALGAAPAQRG